MTKKDFIFFIKEIQKEAQLKKFSVKVVFRDIFDDAVVYGPYFSGRRKKGRFHIVINKNQNLSTQIDYFIHEYAHVLTYDKKGSVKYFSNDEKNHGLDWGKSYSIVYRAFLRVSKRLYHNNQ